MLTQYQNCDGPKSAVSLIIELYNNNKKEMLKTANCMDEILEESVRKFHGFVRRTVACTACIISASSSSLLNRTISPPPTCEKCLNPVLAEDLVRLKEIKIFGNFRDFEDINLNTEEGIFLDGALKITNSNRSQFKVRGRICRSSDFDRIVSHLKEEEKMVIKTYFFLN